jgi:hypothetical protein
MIADLANTMAQHREWNPKTLHSGFISLTEDRPKLEDQSIPYAPAWELLMNWEISEFGSTDAYIDDIFTVFPYVSEDHLQRGRNAALLAIDTFGRPVALDDDSTLPRDPIVALTKLIAEGTPTEILTVLGWQIDTRRMILQLPADKAKLWDADVKRLIKLGNKGSEVGVKRLEKVQGRNVNVAMIVPGAVHFHSHMYQAIARAKKYKTTRLTVEERLDLCLLRHMLALAK